MIVHSVKFDRRIANAALVSGIAVRGGTIGEPGSHDLQGSSVTIGESDIPEGELVEEQAETAAVVELLNKISLGVANVQLQTEPLVKEMQTLSIRLATMIVKKILGSSEMLQAKRLECLIADAFQRAESVVAVYINPLDCVGLVSCQDDELMTNVAIKSDETISQGECRIEFASHELISNLEYQMTEIEHRLLEVVHDDAG